ncbi:hypothetical protein HMI54_014092 [Coelomomyces lativittatus]|nr:hypothetical protein HMI54_014092 [Coelomomyces lativittatus]
MVEDIPGLTFPKSNPFSPNFSSLKQGKPASKNTELYGCFTENWVFKHSKLPIEAKLIHCCPNNRKAYLTLHFSLTLELDSVVKVEYWQLILCTFLDAICSVASAFPSTSVL